MATSKAEYLKRYMSDVTEPENVSKKKRRKKKVMGAKAISGFKIVDEDIDLSKIRAGDQEDEEEDPIVAEVIDERPDAVRHMEEYVNSSKWKKLVNDETNTDISRKQPPSDTSPSHHQSRGSDNSPPRHQRHDSDDSPPRRQRHDSDNSPPHRQRHDSDHSPPRRQRHDSDISPPRSRRHDSDNSPPRRQRHDSDNSPLHRQRHDSDHSPPRRQRHDSDHSPPRRQGHGSDHSLRQRHADSDNSPPRRQRRDSDNSPPRKPQKDLNSSSSKATTKTLSGKAAGLSSAKDMKMESEHLRLRELEMFNKIGDDKLGRNADTVFRDKATGRKRNLKHEKQQDDAKQAEWKEKYDKWAKGVAQGAAEEERVAEMVHEMNKPLARSKDDADLDAFLKVQDRAGDPMLAFMKKKKEAKSSKPKYPKYKGPAPAPNRYGILPGYRWDGVDRCNGFEKKYFQSLSKNKAVASEAYKWSIEDM